MSASIQRIPSEAAGSREASQPLLLVAVFLVAIAPFFVTPILPMIDYYGHVARYYVLAQIDQPFLAQHYRPNWAILPNIGLDVIGTALMKVTPPLLAAKIIMVLVFATQYWGVLFFNRQLTGKTSLLTALLATFLLYSFIFTSGFANFLLGLGLVFWGAGWWLWARGRPALAIPVACVIAVAIFLAHGVAFALYGILLGGLEIGLFLARRDRNWAGLAKSMAALAVQAVVPAILFMASPTAQSSGGVTNADEAVKRLANSGLLWDRIRDLVDHRLTTILRVAEGPYAELDFFSLAVIAGVLVLLALRGRVRIGLAAWPALALAAVLIAVVPPTLFGVGRVGDRMPLFAAFVLVGVITADRLTSRPDRLLLGALGALMAARIVLIGASWLPYRSDFDHFLAVVRKIEAPSVVGYVNLANSYRVDPNLRCEMYGPVLPLKGHATPIFAFESQQPIALAGRLDAANESLGYVAPSARREERQLVNFRSMSTKGQFDYAVVCGARPATPPPGASLVASSGRFSLYSLVRAPATSAATAASPAGS